MSLLLRDVEVAGKRVDVRTVDGQIDAIGPVLDDRGAEVVDGCGGALLPGLTDHHLHLLAMAADLGSVRCTPSVVRDEDGLAEALGAAHGDAHGWVRGVGYHEDVAGPLDAEVLDQVHADRPVRIQHASGAVWFLNSAALSSLDLASADHPGIERGPTGDPIGRLWRADDWLRSRLPASPPVSLRETGRRLATLGITSVTDATPRLDRSHLDLIRTALSSGDLSQHVTLLGAPLDTDLRESRLAAGPWKIVLADSGLPGLDQLVAEIRAAHVASRPVAAHSVTTASLLLFLAALDEAGRLPGDRVEHAAVVPPEVVPMLAERGLRVVTQPGFLADRGDRFAAGTPADEHGDLYRCRSLLDVGVLVALSSDAPYGPVDPWQVIAAAAKRRTPAGDVLGPAETIAPAAALAAYLAPADDPGGTPQQIEVGGAADLVLLDRPLATALQSPSAEHVRAVFIAGRRI